MTDLQAASTALGIQTVLGRNDLMKSYRDPATDSRTPDFFVVSQKGVIYTGGSKLAEHGGVADDDRANALWTTDEVLTRLDHKAEQRTGTHG